MGETTKRNVTADEEREGGDDAAGVRFTLADYTDPAQTRDLVALLDTYARDPMGGGEPLAETVRETLGATLARTPNAFTILGYADGEPVALANCFETLSTFAARPLVNVHDLAVVAGYRGRGIGRALLDAVEREAHARGACKITLEVLEGNGPARRAYERAGFHPYALDESVGTALFLQKRLAKDG